MDIVKIIVNDIDWAWFSSKPASVIGLVLALGGILLNMNSDAKATKLISFGMIVGAIIIIAGKLMFENGVVPL